MRLGRYESEPSEGDGVRVFLVAGIEEREKRIKI